MDKEEQKDELKQLLWEKEMDKIKNKGVKRQSTVEIDNRLNRARRNYKKLLLDETRKEEGRIK